MALTSHIVHDLFKELSIVPGNETEAPTLTLHENTEEKGECEGNEEERENQIGGNSASSQTQAPTVPETNCLSHENDTRVLLKTSSKRKRAAFLPPQQRIMSTMSNPSAKGFGSSLFGSDFTLTKEMLLSVRVINQLDQKFIICKIDDLLLAVDQHAADERVRYEKMEKQMFGECGQKRNLQVEFLSRPLDVETNEHERYLLERFRACLESWGWSFSLSGQKKVSLFSVPKVMDVILDHQGFLKEFVSELEESGGSRYLKPRSITKILQSKACRGAIMFGDTLDLRQCEEIMEVGLLDFFFPLLLSSSSSFILFSFFSSFNLPPKEFSKMSSPVYLRPWKTLCPSPPRFRNPDEVKIPRT